MSSTASARESPPTSVNRDASEPISPGTAGSGVVDFARVQSSAAKNGGIEILGPPPFTRPDTN